MTIPFVGPFLIAADYANRDIEELFLPFFMIGVAQVTSIALAIAGYARRARVRGQVERRNFAVIPGRVAGARGMMLAVAF